MPWPHPGFPVSAAAQTLGQEQLHTQRKRLLLLQTRGGAKEVYSCEYKKEFTLVFLSLYYFAQEQL